MDTPSAHENTGVFKRRLRDVALQAAVANIGKVLSFAGGVLAAYLAIWSQISEAKHAAADAQSSAGDLKASVAELRKELKELVTEKELEDAKERIGSLEDRLNYAQHWHRGMPDQERPH